MRTVWGALLIAALGFGEARAQAGSANFERWSAVCDEVGECSAWASNGNWLAPSYLLLRRSADGQWSAHFGVSTSDNELKAIELKVIGPDGAATWTGRFSSAPDDQSMRRTSVLATSEVAVLRDAIAQGLTLGAYANGKIDGPKTISLKGSAATLLWIQNRRPDPHYPAIRRPPVASQTHLPKVSSMGDSLCYEPDLTRLSPGKILAETSCRVFEDKSGSYTTMQLLDENGSRLPGPEIEDYVEEDSYGLAGATYDPKTLTLSGSQYGEYRPGSCGWSTEWVWDGERFRVAHEKGMIDCVGIPRELWPSKRRVRVIDARAHR
ncbi:DUF1176 domain-containing protein [Caulobacter sp. LARHSG274]